MKIVNYFGIIFLVFLLQGCGLDDQSKQRAERLNNSINTSLSTINDIEKQLDSDLQKSDFSFLKSYADKEKWKTHFSKAKQQLNEVRSLYDSKIKIMLDKNDSDDQHSFNAWMANIESNLREVTKTAQKPNERKIFLVKAKKEAPSLYKDSTSKVSQLQSLIIKAQVYSEKAKVDYPAKSQDILGRFASLRKFLDDSVNMHQIATGEFNKISSSKVNYAVLADSIEFISNALISAKTREVKLKNKLNELYRSYSKVLSDMNIEYYIVIGRETWDSASDWESDDNYTYTSKVDEKVYEYFASKGNIAQYGIGWGSDFELLGVSQAMWNALKYNYKHDWPSSSNDEAEFWISNDFSKTYHKYTIIENGKTKETDWIKVSEDEYWKQEGNLGMTIASKPYGMYEEETIKTAVPVGAAYLAKPKIVNGVPTGSNQYGNWKQGSNGTSFWEFYGQYAFMSNMLGGGSRYSYDDWDDYDRRDRKKSYYGKNDKYGTYGSATYNSKSRYARSSFAQRNSSIVSQSKRTTNSSYARGKGGKSSSKNGVSSAIRGRGPGGKGK
jgi:hypothetical protein